MRVRFHGSGIVVAALSLAILAGASSVVFGDAATTSSAPPEMIAAGKAIFFEYCSGCHGRRADGRGPQAANLKPRPQNLRNTQFVRHLTDDRLYTSISGGVRGTAMPPFELTLAPEKRRQAIAYIRSLTADDTLTIANSLAVQNVPADAVNPLAHTDAVVAHGRQVFGQYCTSCHGPKADGTGMLSPSLVPQPRNLVVVTSWGEKPFIDYLSDARLYSSITNGVAGTSMQPFVEVLSDEDRWSAIMFLRARADQERSIAPAP